MSLVVPKKGSNLNDYLRETRRGTRLLGAVEKHMTTRVEPPRREDCLHPSEIVKEDWCHRASWFVLKGYGKKAGGFSARLLNVFDEGHAIHDKWQTRFREMGNLFGRWECLVCKDTWWERSPEGCQTCGSTLLAYREVPLTSDERFGISGHSDGWVQGLGRDCLIEIKSIGMGTVRFEAPRIAVAADGDVEVAWRQIKAPFRSHRLQGAIYLELGAQMVLNGFFDEFPDEIVFIYELKATQEYKEFVVQRDRELVKPILRAARDITAALDTGVPPSCNLDSTSGCEKCRGYVLEEVA